MSKDTFITKKNQDSFKKIYAHKPKWETLTLQNVLQPE